MPRPDPWFYFNGFNGAILEDFSGNAKISAVAGQAGRQGFEFRPVSVCYRRAAEHRDEILAWASEADRQVVLSGSSMGGWFARILQLELARLRPELHCVALAFNPAFDLEAHGHLLLGQQQNFVTGESYTWTPVHQEALAALERAVDYDSDRPFHVYVDRGDEVIDWQASASRHQEFAHFVDYPGGCHSFDHYHEALEDFSGRYRQ